MLRDYQEELAGQAAEILKKWHIVYLAMEMRVGKTLIALETAKLLNYKNVMFITKLKAISSILADYAAAGYKYKLTVINYEQAGKYGADYDLVIADEAHSLGAYPKPTKRTHAVDKLLGRADLMLLSGTPTPESYSQIFHQFWVSNYSPWYHVNFYSWAREYVDVRERFISGRRIKDYSHADKERIEQEIKPYMLTYTREQAGFKIAEVTEEIVTIPLNSNIQRLVKILLRDLYYKLPNGDEVLCDTPVKLQSKLHQVYSGTVKTESGDVRIVSRDKARYIVDKYLSKGLKIAVFYKFIAEGLLLKELIPDHTDDPMEFRDSKNLTFISQIQAGSMGVNLASADILIFYNIDFSAVQYWQARARIQDMSRERIPLVHWLFTEGGIEEKIYKVVQKKRDYTIRYFRQDFGMTKLSGTRFDKIPFNVSAEAV